MWSDIFDRLWHFYFRDFNDFTCNCSYHGNDYSAKQRNATHHGELVVKDLSEEFKETVKHLRDFQLSEEELKQAEKVEKKAKKQEAKALKSKIKKQ